jgi:hypothetical protein
MRSRADTTCRIRAFTAYKPRLVPDNPEACSEGRLLVTAVGNGRQVYLLTNLLGGGDATAGVHRATRERKAWPCGVAATARAEAARRPAREHSAMRQTILCALALTAWTAAIEASHAQSPYNYSWCGI